MLITAHSRCGSVLVATFGLLLFLAFLIATTTDRSISTSQQVAFAAVQQQAAYAAESVAALKEVELVNLAATNDLAGLASMSNQADGTWRGSEWFGNCVVRWRIEPVIVRSTAGEYTFNPDHDSSIPPPTDPSDASRIDPDWVANYEFYNFRIATEAYYLSDQDNAAEPWNHSDRREAMVQSTRLVQLKLNSLFKYALFYAAEGPDGDIEFHNGPAMAVAGAVHSNGAIYFGGNTVSGHHPGDNGDVDIGSGLEPKTCVGVDGIYRTQKPTFYQAWIDGVVGSQDPFNLPRPGETDPITGRVMVGSDNVNAGDPGSTTYRINGKAMRPEDNDSRSPDGMASTWSAYVRDGRTRGATVVKTLANIPELGGRPFEHQRLASDSGLYLRDPSGGDDTLTILPDNPPAPWYADPDGINGDPDDDYRFINSDALASYPNAQLVSLRSERLYYLVNDPLGPGDVASRSQLEALYPMITDTNGNGTSVDEIRAADPGITPVSAAGMPLYHQRDADGNPLFGTTSALVDVTDPLQNGNDSSRSWYDPTAAYMKYIDRGGVADLDPLADGDASGDEEDGFAINLVRGHYLERAILGDDSTEPGFGLVILERPAQFGYGQVIPTTNDYRDPNYSNAIAMAAVEDSGGFFNHPDYQTQSPQMDYEIDFLTTGTWYVWVRGHGPSGGSAQIYVGIDGSSEAQNVINLSSIGDSSSSGWSSPVKPLEVSSAGRHTLNLWMGKDGVVIDKIVLSTDKFYDKPPSSNPLTSNGGKGPPETRGHHVANSDGVVMEAENFSASWYGSGTYAGMAWSFTGELPDSTGSGAMLVADNGNNAGLSTTGPRLDYRIEFSDPGTYEVYLLGRRASGTLGGIVYAGSNADDSVHVGLNGSAVSLVGTGLTNFVEGASWQGEAGGSQVTVTVPTAGTHTFHLWMREDGTIIDKIVLQRSGPAPSGDGPDMSPQRFAEQAQTVVLEAEHYSGRIQRGDWSWEIAGTTTEGWSEYLTSNYVVYFGSYIDAAGNRVLRDISSVFFDHVISAGAAGHTMSESWVRNRRETGYKESTFDLTGKGIDPNNYQVNMLNLHLDVIGDFIKTTDWSVIDPSATPGVSTVASQFNGMIYAARTRRSAGYDPIDTPQWHPDRMEDWGATDYVAPLHGFTDPVLMAEQRTGDGPSVVFDSSVRISQAATIDWGGEHVDDSGYRRARGFTLITPNQAFIDGDFNVTALPDSNGVNQLPPSAIFCDHLTVLSNSWDDAAEVDFSPTLQTASETTYNCSVVTNNVPTIIYNGTQLRTSGGPHNLVRYLENWSGVDYHIKGSTVVMGPARYTMAEAGSSSSTYGLGVRFYRPPVRDLQFNTDLFDRAGQPPFTPFGVQVIRTVSTVHPMGR